jgi:xanthine dehydrogenase accessory factor
MDSDSLVLIRGGGDLASGIAHRLTKCRIPVVISEIPRPTVIRRTVAFAAAVEEGQAAVEGITARHVPIADARRTLADGVLPVVTGEYPELLRSLRPWAVVDAIIAKRNLGTKINDASITVGVGPGFTAGVDVTAVVETMRGHDLGRVITSGGATPDTGVPGEIAGYSSERLLRAPGDGIIAIRAEIATLVKKGDIVATVGDRPVVAALDGVLRGMIRDGFEVHQGMKIGDIDPRCKREHCFTISDKARAVAGGVLEALLSLR